ncbi:MAG: L-2-amino-thiazoline-4-carboxylic acid hydrolase [Thermoproteales archaeon]|nr:L-2-amino-thiazoline-4-carboxylic acid hydrolase [Thermoproteales archaeon]
MFNPVVHDYEIVRKSDKVLEVVAKKCLHAEIFNDLNAEKVGLKLICMGDDAATEGYNPKLKLRRPKILMRGDDVCHFIWELEE